MSYCAAMGSGALGREHLRYHDHDHRFPWNTGNEMTERGCSPAPA